MTFRTTREQRDRLDVVRDALYGSPLIWFGQSGSNDEIVPVTAAFFDASEAYDWALDHRDQTVHFPGGIQLASWAATQEGPDAFLTRVTTVIRS